MRITMVGTLPPVKGISKNYCLPLAEAVSRLIDVDFLSFRRIYPERLYPGGTREGEPHVFDAACRVRPRHRLDWFNPAGWAWSGLTMRGRLLHVHWWTYYLAPVELTLLACAKLRGMRVVLTVHNVLGHETNRIDHALTRLACAFADRFIVHTEINRRRLKEVFGIRPERVRVIPHGALTSYDDAPLTREEARTQLGIPPDAEIALFFGNIRPYKGLDALLRALKLVVAARPNAKLIVAGTCWTDWGVYDRLIDELEIRPWLDLRVGYVPTEQVKVLFRASDVCVLPYAHFESQSGPGNVALAFGTPLVVTRTGGLPALVRQPEAIAEPEDDRSLADAIVRCLADPSLRERMSADADALKDEFSWTRIAERTVTLYEELLHA